MDSDVQLSDGESSDKMRPLPEIGPHMTKTQLDAATKNRRLSTPHPIKARVSRRPSPCVNGTPSTPVSNRCRRSLPRSVSEPDLRPDATGLESSHTVVTSRRPFDVAHDSKRSSAVNDGRRHFGLLTSNNYVMAAMYTSTCRQAFFTQVFTKRKVLFAEALWNHMTLDPVELAFRAGDIIEVKDMLDKDWWWGKIGDKEGWFPSAFVVIQTSSYEFVVDCCPALPGTQLNTRSHIIRGKVVLEILAAERDYVRLLHDVIEGYLERTKRRPDMFTAECVLAIFGNIERIFEFSTCLLADLEKAFRLSDPGGSTIGNLFLKNQKGFELYSDYCNNHPRANDTLFSMKYNTRYQQFFEACRLLQGMVNIPLDGFLLTPIQKICKYPVQLKELLRHTPAEHDDFVPLQSAVEAMKKIAALINERKRKMESVEMLVRWQESVSEWQGPPLIDRSSELICSGELMKISSNGWCQERVVYLFDHQLVYCKKDLLWRDMLTYRGRINMDSCTIDRIEGRLIPGASVQYGFKLYDEACARWYVFACHNVDEYNRWSGAFDDERRRVAEDQLSGFESGTFKAREKCVQRQRPQNFQGRSHRERQYRCQPITLDDAALITSSGPISPGGKSIASMSATLRSPNNRPTIKKTAFFRLIHRNRVT